MITALAALAAVVAALFLFTAVQSRRIEARYPPAGILVDVGDGVLHVVETDPAAPERGPLLLVHGASGNFADLNVALADRLAALGFRVFSVDRPGHGWSARLGGREMSSPERQAAAVREALSRLGVDQAIVVVHSLAGVLGLCLAMNSPDFVRGLVLLAPASHPWVGGVIWYYRLAATPFWGALFRRLLLLPAGMLLTRSGVRSVFEPSPTPPDYVERTRLPLVFRPEHFRANAEDVADLEGYIRVLSKRYGEIRTPTAVLTGDHDGVVYAHIHSTGCARDIPGATLRVLEGVGHSPHYSAPDAVVEAILEVDRRAREADVSAPVGVASSAG